MEGDAFKKAGQPSKYLHLLGFPSRKTLAIEGAKFKRAAFGLPGHECSGSLLPLWQVIRAGVVELVDTLDLGSSAARRGGSSPFARTTPGFVTT